VTLVDLNGDGAPDLLASADSGVEVLLNHGDGTFAAPLKYPGSYRNWVTDLNGDHRPDLLDVDSDGHLRVIMNHGDGSFADPITTPISVLVNDTLVLGDLDGDGRPDLVISTWTGDVNVVMNHGDGTFAAPLASPRWAPLSTWATSTAMAGSTSSPRAQRASPWP